MEKIENEEIKQYLKSFAIQSLGKCELFTKTFGKNFARKRLELNLNKVYTNEVNKKHAGYHNPNDASITLCTKVENSDPLRVEDIENNNSLQSTCLHEAIHAILERTKLECKIMGIKSGTGMLEFYNNGNELGRGLNEGLTNWICEKAQFYPNSYLMLTNFINELELAIGEKNVMKLAKGDIKKNIAKQLQMSTKESQSFLAIADEIYSLQERERKLDSVLETIISYKIRDKLTPANKEKAERNYVHLFEEPLYIQSLESKEYKQYLEKLEQGDTIDTRKAWFIDLCRNTSKEIETSKCLFESIIFNKYFKKEFEALLQMETIPVNKLKKFDELNELTSINEINRYSEIGYFKQEYEKLTERYSEGIYSQVEELFRNGDLSGDKLNELHELSKREVTFTDEKFLYRIAELVCPSEPSKVGELLCDLANNGQLKDANKYSILKIDVENLEINAYEKNGQVVDIQGNYFGFYNNESSDKDENHTVFDFSLGDNEEYKSIMAQFLELKKNVQAENPNATIKILDRLIVVENNDEQELYVIIAGKLLPATAMRLESIKLNLAPNEVQLPVEYKNNVFGKMLMAIKKKLLRNPSENINYNNIVTKKSKQRIFKDNIKDMSQYSDCIPEVVDKPTTKDREQTK